MLNEDDVMRPSVYWVEDSVSLCTCHANLPNMSFQQSLIGSLRFEDDKWHAILMNGKNVGSGSYYRARVYMEEYYKKHLEGMYKRK